MSAEIECHDMDSTLDWTANRVTKVDVGYQQRSRRNGSIQRGRSEAFEKK